MPDAKSGVIGNGYAYEPFKEEENTYSSALGATGSVIGGVLGGIAGKAFGSIAKEVGSETGEKLGQSTGEQIGHIINNTDTIVQNTKTFLAELSDWRTWASMGY